MYVADVYSGFLLYICFSCASLSASRGANSKVKDTESKAVSKRWMKMPLIFYPPGRSCHSAGGSWQRHVLHRERQVGGTALLRGKLWKRWSSFEGWQILGYYRPHRNYPVPGTVQHWYFRIKQRRNKPLAQCRQVRSIWNLPKAGDTDRRGVLRGVQLPAWWGEMILRLHRWQSLRSLKSALWVDCDSLRHWSQPNWLTAVFLRCNVYISILNVPFFG